MVSRHTIVKYTKTILSILGRILGLVAIYKIYTVCDWKSIGQILGWKSAFIIMGAVAVYAIKQLVDALRNKRLANAMNVPITFMQFLKFNMQSVAFTFALPLPQAEEVYRFGRFAGHTSKKTAVILAVTIRATGLTAVLATLLMTTIFTSLKLKPLLKGGSMAWLFFIGAGIVIAGAIGLLYVRTRRKKNPAFLEKYIEVLEMLRQSFHQHKFTLLEGVALSFLSQMSYAASIYLICIFNGASISYFTIFLIVPLIYFGGMVPASIAGLGIKEAVIAWSLQEFGVPKPLAWNIALFHLVLMLIYLLIGALWLLVERRVKEAVTSERLAE